MGVRIIRRATLRLCLACIRYVRVKVNLEIKDEAHALTCTLSTQYKELKAWVRASLLYLSYLCPFSFTPVPKFYRESCRFRVGRLPVVLFCADSLVCTITGQYPVQLEAWTWFLNYMRLTLREGFLTNSGRRWNFFLTKQDRPAFGRCDIGVRIHITSTKHQKRRKTIENGREMKGKEMKSKMNNELKDRIM